MKINMMPTFKIVVNIEAWIAKTGTFAMFKTAFGFFPPSSSVAVES